MSLSNIQTSLKAPKGQFNNFGKYSYRSCEDIVESVKPLLRKYGYALLISDEICMVGERFYVKATAKLLKNDGAILAECTAYAREPLDKKGMDVSQITGAASSYARKYALNGLLAIDDTKDADSNEQNVQQNKQAKKRVNKEVGQRYIAAFLDAIETEDGLALRQLGEELKDTPEYEFVWQSLNSKQKQSVRDLIRGLTAGEAGSVL